MKLSLRKARPQRHTNVCADCDGRGRWSEDDFDGESPQVVVVTCEACSGFRYVGDCELCDEPTASGTLELLNGMCNRCAAAKEISA